MVEEAQIKGQKEDPAMGYHEPRELALLWFEKAQSGSLTWPDNAPEEVWRARKLRKRLKPVRDCCKYLLLFLGFFEAPTWCAADLALCTAKGTPNVGAYQLPPMVANLIGFTCWLYISFSLVLRRRALGDAYHFSAWHVLASASCIVSILDCTIALAPIERYGIMSGGFRVSYVLRPIIYLCLSKRVREAAERIIRCTGFFYDVLLAVIISILMSSWAVLILFGGAESFQGWYQTIANMFILFTTANCPDVFIESFQKNRLAFTFFAVYIIIMIYLLTNLLVSSVYDGYKSLLVDMLQKHYHNRTIASKKSFDALSEGKGYVNEKEFSGFFLLYCYGSTEMDDSEGAAHDFNVKRSRDIFQVLDQDKSGKIDEKEFKAVIDALVDETSYVPKSPVPDGGIASYLGAFLTDGVDIMGTKVPFRQLEDILIAIDVGIAFYVSCLYISPNNGGRFDQYILSVDGPWFWLMFCFACFYALEVTMKIFCLGFERYWHMSPVRHRFDFFNNYFMFIVSVYCIVNPTNPEWMFRQILMQHIVRSMRLLTYIKPLKFVVMLTFRLIPAYYRMGTMLFLVYYVFAMLGIEFFGGHITLDNPALKGTGYADANYFTLNFNDFASAMATLFVLMVVNNWFVIAAAFMKTSGSWWPAAYFVSFFVICNLIVLNILMALILDCSSGLRGDIEGAGENEAKSHSLKYEDMLRRVLDVQSLEDDVPSTPTPRADLAEEAASASNYGATPV